MEQSSAPVLHDNKHTAEHRHKAEQPESSRELEQPGARPGLVPLAFGFVVVVGHHVYIIVIPSPASKTSKCGVWACVRVRIMCSKVREGPSKVRV
jgi:hypothetical protein